MVFAGQEELILHLRRARQLGIEMPRDALLRRQGLRLALDTPPKLLVRHGENRRKRPRLKRQGTQRSSRPVPGDRVPLDTGKLRPGLYRYTAIDDCSRWQVLGLDPRRTAADTRDFLDRIRAGMPSPVPRVQAGRGPGFFADEVPGRPRDRRIKSRPNRPRAPHLDGKVERVQRTALGESRPTVDPGAPDLAARREDGRTFHHHDRPHGALGGGTPAERIKELAPKIPTFETVHAAHDPSRESIRSPNTRYRWLPTNARAT